MMFARPARMAHPDAVRVAQQPQPQQQPQKKVVDLKADIMYPIDYRDTSAVCLVGNVAFYHSGAVITCDSAVRYSEKHMECFGNVLINKNSTYVYGDRADYNGETHVARVYSDLIKVIDGEATLYTYKFLFNTVSKNLILRIPILGEKLLVMIPALAAVAKNLSIAMVW